MLGVLRGGRVALVALAALVGSIAVQGSGSASPATVPTHGYMDLVGSMHEHSGYSDGWPGSTPATYYASGKHFGLDFLAGSEHSDTAKLPIVASDYCVGAEILSCIGGDPQHPAYVLHKWRSELRYAREATTANFVGLRGFEWTSDRFGHINVYFSRNDTNAKIDGGYASMDAFWSWFGRAPLLAGGSDGLATFNHPGDKKLVDNDPGFNWNDFAYRAAFDDRMVGIELYNDVNEYGTSHGGTDPFEGYYAHALDKGWHLGAVGAEDLGHRKTDDWGGPSWAKTVMLTTNRSAAAMRAAMVARRFYAVKDRTVRLDFTVDGALMGSRLMRTSGAPLTIHASVNRPTATIELVTSVGQVVATGTGGTLDHVLPASLYQRYYFIRVRVPGVADPIAYSSPVWVGIS